MRSVYHGDPLLHKQDFLEGGWQGRAFVLLPLEGAKIRLCTLTPLTMIPKETLKEWCHGDYLTS